MNWYRWDGGWVENNGDQTRYCVWPLDEDSVVFEVGGYEGHWAYRMAEKYNPHLYVFEPAPRAYEICRAKLSVFPKVKIFKCGLGNKNASLLLGDSDRDGASFLNDENTVTAQMIDAVEMIRALRVTKIDLMAINIEGGEFELLPHIIGAGLINLISRFMIQWHLTAGYIIEHMREIQNDLARTHRMLWNHGAWEAWIALA